MSGDILDEGDARAAVAMRGSLQGMGERRDRGGGSSQSGSAALSGGGSKAGGDGGGGGGDDNDNDNSVVISDADAADSVTRASQNASVQGLEGGGSVIGGSVAGGSVVGGSVGTMKGLLARNEVPFAILGKQANKSPTQSYAYLN